MHNFILLWEPSDAAYSKQLEIGNLFINSLGIDENIAHEISNISSLSKDLSKSMTDAEQKLKEQTDSETIFSALQMINENEGIPHIIYAGDYYHRAFDNVLKSIVVKNMKKISMKKVWLTKLRMQRYFAACFTKTLSESDHRKFVQVQINEPQPTSKFNFQLLVKPPYKFIMHLGDTKENEFSRNIIFSKPDYFQESVFYDLETFIETLDDGIMDFSRTTYHMSKMTQEERGLLAMKDQEFLESFYVYSLGQNPDVKKIEMESSESESRYILSRCSRQTLILENNSKLFNSLTVAWNFLRVIVAWIFGYF